jgi:hypothetical protein
MIGLVTVVWSIWNAVSLERESSKAGRSWLLQDVAALGAASLSEALAS